MNVVDHDVTHYGPAINDSLGILGSLAILVFGRHHENHCVFVTRKGMELESHTKPLDKAFLGDQ